MKLITPKACMDVSKLYKGFDSVEVSFEDPRFSIAGLVSPERDNLNIEPHEIRDAGAKRISGILGFESVQNFEVWVDWNRQIWKNQWGSNMFENTRMATECAFDKKASEGPLTFRHVWKKWENVAIEIQKILLPLILPHDPYASMNLVNKRFEPFEMPN